ncbi:MAG: Alkyl hydroperoxide reductase and/or thiol-specific antioxidant family (AhpC/TSA) protein, partial [Planctomycetaceae bacterium]|nr:Alkyl hydroperoxide reductase and/or thiol-specific antioxidant family (AhpC/TSA) protein [Planctomycetaceae bacterium]
MKHGTDEEKSRLAPAEKGRAVGHHPRWHLTGFALMTAIATCLASASSPVQHSKFNRIVEIGKKAPEWKDLPGVDGKPHSLAELKDSKIVVVIFLRNNCPIAQAYEGRILAFIEKYRNQKVTVIGINVSAEPGEDLEKMKAR